MSIVASPRAETPDTAEFAPSWWYLPGDHATQPLDHGTENPGHSNAASLWRVLMAARLILASALLVMQIVAWRGESSAPWLVVLCAAHVGAGLLALLVRVKDTGQDHAGAPRWLLTVWADVAVFAALQAFAPDNLNYTPLLVWPVLLAAVAGMRSLALGCAAAGTFALLAATWLDNRATPGSSEWLQAALTSSGLFIVALLASLLSARLAREQNVARHNQRLARLHQRVNQLIATGLDEGIIVLDERGSIWYGNAAATCMLGASDADARLLRQTPAWPALAGWAMGAMRSSTSESGHPCSANSTSNAVRDFILPLPNGGQRRVRARLCAARVSDLPAAAVLFLADMHDLEQRLHREKLAAMGRMSAAVAHEIRNPLAAIAQASALLAEDELSPTQRHLVGLIEQSARRLGRTVDDILEVTRPPSPDEPLITPALALDEAVDEVLTDWLRQRPQGARLQRHTGGQDARIAFDPEHLRRVLVNLLDNADRHAPPAPGTIRVETDSSADHAAITVWNEGPELPPHVRAHLFEPFTTSRSRSSGLGLYLSRELCQRYHARLDYERSARDGREGHAFCVRMARRF
jgi:two-component system sensor histidine kinase PilS (NtrC family)